MNRMKYYRGKLGLSCEQVARRIGCSNSLAAGVESSQIRSYPKIRREIAEVLGVPESEIFDEKGWVRDDEIGTTDSNQ